MSVEHWEKYYRDGPIATCPTSAAGEYDRELRDVWTDFLEWLPDGSSILDVATGNGAVVLIAKETAQSLGRQWSIHGADLARIDPVAHVVDGKQRFAGCHFHPGMAMESLEFDDRSFDAVTGHYALEYADPNRALGEIFRVLRPASRARFIVHHADSVLVANARRSLAESEFVLVETRVYRYLRRLVSMPDAAPRLDGRETRALRHRIHLLQQAHHRARQVGGGHVLQVTLDAIRHILAARPGMSPNAAELEVDRIESELRASVRRLHDLIERAHDDERMAALERTAREAGFEPLECERQYHAQENLVGWRLTLARPH